MEAQTNTRRQSQPEFDFCSLSTGPNEFMVPSKGPGLGAMIDAKNFDTDDFAVSSSQDDGIACDAKPKQTAHRSICIAGISAGSDSPQSDDEEGNHSEERSNPDCSDHAEGENGGCSCFKPLSSMLSSCDDDSFAVSSYASQPNRHTALRALNGGRAWYNRLVGVHIHASMVRQKMKAECEQAEIFVEGSERAADDIVVVRRQHNRGIGVWMHQEAVAASIEAGDWRPAKEEILYDAIDDDMEEEEMELEWYVGGEE
mmetsp:Transcript_37246/g.76338  ORF Transcript_37246/g.76338 Transcript_37246/m.76338 type:complete len:257 (+) Transcript_37246:90-860(+)|eukprot:CAMPEP_0181313678 /NCGR_PEP_ID=MMETSP1101-20121128/14380_1 /TAXON_ID=46948 /ORGANISM="Rhodomonas abbreviata, Strain Caron Lab Isolate" /LENGTH=256 /DNA_ID=CAMNT_0023420655 /DNA_START=77 /DNA_END=847 /DNA_ORIENTATION=+